MTEDPRAPQMPRRRSVKDKFAEVPPPRGSAPSNPLTETTTTAIGGLDMLSSAYRVAQGGQVVHDQMAAPLAAPLQRLEAAHVIDLEWARSHHLLLLSVEVDADELEALAVSVWEDAGWAGPGMLRLGGVAALQGPWQVDARIRHELGTAADLAQAWVLVCPPTRGPAPTAELMERDEWARAFPSGMPSGVEYRALLGLRRMARRLAGALLIAGSGHVITPDPDSAVNLTVYSPRWVLPDDLLGVLRPDFPTIVDSRDLGQTEPSRPTRREVHRISALVDGRVDLPEEVQRSIEESRRRAASQPQVVDGYALVAPVGNRSQMLLEVRQVAIVPQALRWEAWSNGAVVEYRLRWLPAGGPAVLDAPLTRTARLERLRSATGIEEAAGLVFSVVGGSVLDEDGFLVALDNS